MPCEHQSHRGGGRPRFAVAAMPDAAPKVVIYAILADFSVAKELRTGTQKAKIMKCLHYGNTSFAAGAVYGWRNHDEGVVNMHDIGIFADEEGAEITMRVTSPYGPHHECGPADDGEFFDLMVAAAVGNYRVPHMFQEPPFLFEDSVFAARLLIGVMNEDDFHGRVSSQMLLGKSPGGRYEAHIPSMLFCGS